MEEGTQKTESRGCANKAGDCPLISGKNNNRNYYSIQAISRIIQYSDSLKVFHEYLVELEGSSFRIPYM